MGYFANAQYDVLFLHVILNEVKNPTEELTGHILFTLVVGYFADAQYDVKSPIVGFADTSPEGGSKKSFRKPLFLRRYGITRTQYIYVLRISRLQYVYALRISVFERAEQISLCL